ncbi:MAG: hypothetical protein AAGI12_11350 [Pseudomonadota bacterium]
MNSLKHRFGTPTGPTLKARTRSAGHRQAVGLWLAGFGFVVLILALLLLSRVGLPASVGIQLTLALLGAGFTVALWVGKTMTSPDYFYASRSAPTAIVGLGGAGDWLGGAMLLVLALSPLQQRTWLIVAVMSAIALQMILFSRSFQRSGVSTAPGFLIWRYGNRWVGLAALFAIGAALLCVLAAELNVGVTVLSSLTGLPADTSWALFLIVATLPALLGGWKALLMSSSLLTVFVLLAFLAPAIASGFFAPLLAQSQALGMTPSVLSPLSSLFGGNDASLMMGGSPWSPFGPVLLLAVGLSVLPVSLSRLSLSASSQDSLEAGTWSALAAFLAISAIPLSLVLIVLTPTGEGVATVLERSAVLHALPYIALLLAAVSAFSVSLFALGSATARTLLRTSNLDPGERSMFTTRFACFCVATGFWFASDLALPDPQWLIFAALALLAGGLFPAMAAACWVSHLPVWSVILAIVSGTSVPLGILAVHVLGELVLEDPGLEDPASAFVLSLQGFSFAPIALSGLAAALASLLIGRLVVHFSKAEFLDHNLLKVRSSGLDA